MLRVMNRQYVGYDSLIRHTSPTSVESGEVDVLIGNKRCAFLLFSFSSNIMRGALGGDREDMLTLKADIFVFVCTGEASSSPLDEGLVFAVFFSSEENRRLS